MTLEPKKIKSVTVSTASPPICHEVMGPDAMIFIFLFFQSWVLSQLFYSPPSPSSKCCLIPLCFLPLGWCHLHIWGYWYFSLQSWFQLVLNPVLHFPFLRLQNHQNKYISSIIRQSFWIEGLLLEKNKYRLEGKSFKYWFKLITFNLEFHKCFLSWSKYPM